VLHCTLLRITALTVGGCFFDFFANGSSSEDKSSSGLGFSEKKKLKIKNKFLITGLLL